MRGTLTRYVLKLYLGTLAVTALSVLVIYLVADFGDRLKAYLDKPLGAVAELYAHKTAVVFGQLMPAAMLLAAGIAITTLKRRGELDAMRALGISPVRVALPLLFCALPIWAGLVVFDERVASSSSARLDEMRFTGWGDYRFFHANQQWLRLGPDVFRVAASSEPGLLRDVTLFQLSPTFSLERRIDARVMRYVAGGSWELEGAKALQFAGGAPHRVEQERLTLQLDGVEPSAFALKAGRPEQMSLTTLAEQEELRARVGLPTRRYALARHGRFSYPLLGVIGTLLAAGLALRGGRRPALTVALVEGLVVAGSLWGLLVVGRALALAERLPPAVASWGPAVLLLAVAAWVLSRLERA